MKTHRFTIIDFSRRGSRHAAGVVILLAIAAWVTAGAQAYATEGDGIPDDIVVLHSLRYREGAAKDWVLDLAMQKNHQGKPRPAIVVIHGGGWLEGDKSSFYATIFGIRSSDSGPNTLFAMNLDGTGLHTVHLFQGGVNDGKLPTGNLTFLDGFIYGITGIGGANNLGTLWRVHPDGSGFELVHSFLGGTTDGSSPVGGLTLIGSTFYGQTGFGGASNQGTIFAISVPEPSSLAVGILGLAALAVVCARRRRTAGGLRMVHG